MSLKFSSAEKRMKDEWESSKDVVVSLQGSSAELPSPGLENLAGKSGVAVVSKGRNNFFTPLCKS